MSTITYLIYHDNEGDVKLIRPAKGTNPAEGSTDLNEWTIRYYYYEIANRGEWMDTHWWNGSTWVSRISRPNRGATWASGAWTWDEENFKDLVREERNRRLAASDWAVMSDSPITGSNLTHVQEYRTLLRNFPNTTMPTSGRLDDLIWPAAPDFIA
jgi:hypothetical protein